MKVRIPQHDKAHKAYELIMLNFLQAEAHGMQDNAQI